MSIEKIDKELMNIFNVTDFITLSNVKNIVRINFKENIPLVYNEAFDLIKKLFGSDDIYMRITFWDKKEFKKELDIDSIIIDIKETSEEIIVLLKMKKEDKLLRNLLERHLNHDFSLDSTLNITCFYFNFNLKTILNIYDDRGADYLVI